MSQERNKISNLCKIAHVSYYVHFAWLYTFKYMGISEHSVILILARICASIRTAFRYVSVQHRLYYFFVYLSFVSTKSDSSADK